MEKRKEKMLISLINEYIKKATPVASNFLAGRGTFQLSSATIRNELATLEKEGYIMQTHTSSGRVPTELGYNFFLEKLGETQNIDIPEKDQERLTEIIQEVNDTRKVAKIVAELSGEAVILAFSSKDIYYTGFSNLFSKPEFRDQNLICRIGEVVDELDEVINDIFDEIREETEVLIGKRNPFSAKCATIFGKYTSSQGPGFIAILGSTRMNYKKNIGLINYIKKLLAK